MARRKTPADHLTPAERKALTAYRRRAKRNGIPLEPTPLYRDPGIMRDAQPGNRDLYYHNRRLGYGTKHRVEALKRAQATRHNTPRTP